MTNFFNQEYDVTSVEPGGFMDYTNELRNKVLSKNNLRVHNAISVIFMKLKNYLNKEVLNIINY